MKLTSTQLRRLIKEEISKTASRRGRLSEAHARITEDEFAQWKSGNWGYVAEDHHEVSLAKSGDSTRFLHGSEAGHPHDDEGYMVKSRMSSMKKMAADICALLDSGDQLPGWVQDHIAVSHENLQQVHGYLMGDEAMRGHESSPEQMMSVETKVHRTGMILEGHARITAEEMQAWMGGDWGYVDEAVGGFMPGRDDKFMHPAKPPAPLKCADCGKKLTPADKDAYEAEGGQGYPEVCTYCAETP